MARLVPLFLLLAFCASAQELPNADLLEQPPRVATAARCPKVDDWSTPSEKSCYRTTPRYDETMAYISRIAKAASLDLVQKLGRRHVGCMVRIKYLGEDLNVKKGENHMRIFDVQVKGTGGAPTASDGPITDQDVAF